MEEKELKEKELGEKESEEKEELGVKLETEEPNRTG